MAIEIEATACDDNESEEAVWLIFFVQFTCQSRKWLYNANKTNQFGREGGWRGGWGGGGRITRVKVWTGQHRKIKEASQNSTEKQIMMMLMVIVE